MVGSHQFFFYKCYEFIYVIDYSKYMNHESGAPRLDWERQY